MREKIRLNNAETYWTFFYENGTQINQVWFWQVRVFMQYLFSLFDWSILIYRISYD